jgi:hypothetical protein
MTGDAPQLCCSMPGQQSGVMLRLRYDANAQLMVDHT